MRTRDAIAIVVATALLWSGTTSAAAQDPEADTTAAEEESLPTWAEERVTRLFAVLTSRNSRDRGFFVSRCRLSHRLPDDPIVFPGEPGAAHLHDFVGNVTTNAHSTFEDLVGAETTCGEAGDTAAYWTPSLLVDGELTDPLFVSAYYRPARKQRDLIVAFPPDLRVIAGDAHAVAPQESHVVSWRCGRGELLAQPEDAPDCPTTNTVVTVAFPDCWDGVRLDSPDHQEHLAYATGGRVRTCPDTHPVALPQLQLQVYYDLPPGADLALSSGSLDTMHADFWNSWDQPRLEQLVRRCVRANLNCDL